MLFDPDAGRSVEEIIQHKWDHEWSEARKQEILDVAEAMGCNWWDVVLECLERFTDDLEDPVKRQRIERWRDWRGFPFGKDPLLQPKGERDR